MKKTVLGNLIVTIFFLTAFTACSAQDNQILKNSSGTWNLYWSDEFNEKGNPNPANWNYEIGIHPTNGSQYYTNKKENCHQKGGSLFIVALNKPMGGDPYTSARITTKGKVEFTYGRIEFRAKIPQSKGSWPALWMLGKNYSSAGWPACGEIDVMESVGFETPYIHGSAHALNYYWKAGSQQTGKIKTSDADKKFHIYAVEWFEDHIDYYVDEKKYLSVKPIGGDINNAKAWPFNKDQFIIMNLCVDGDWAKTPTKKSFPMIMEIDYVRVYKKSDL